MIVNANSIVQNVIQNKKGIIKHVNMNVKNIMRKCEKDYSWNPSTCNCENSKYLKSVGNISVTECDEIVIVIIYQQKKQILLQEMLQVLLQ